MVMGYVGINIESGGDVSRMLCAPSYPKLTSPIEDDGEWRRQ